MIAPMKPKHRELEAKLSKRGLSPVDWEELIYYRKIYLLDRGENPDHWNVGSRNMSKRFGF